MPTGPALPLRSAQQLGQTLVGRRKQLKLSQQHVATRLGLSQSRISYLELHPQDISLQQLLDWSALVGLEMAVGTKADPSSAGAGW